MTILEKIVKNKRRELDIFNIKSHVKEFERSPLFNRETISICGSLRDKNKTGIIAEFKRKSPSSGIINSTSSAQEVTSGYFREGASGVSVLTDNYFFGGSAADLLAARRNSLVPILRKDFIINDFQVIESKSIGADAILLIAVVLKKPEILNLSRLARSLGLEVLLEIRSTEELDLVNEYVNIIGVNNRNLKTFEVDTGVSEKIAGQIPSGFLKISESGISSPLLLKRLRVAGFDGFLIGEKFMCEKDPVKAFSEFLKVLI